MAFRPPDLKSGVYRRLLFPTLFLLCFMVYWLPSIGLKCPENR
jgi:hypothetical protein